MVGCLEGHFLHSQQSCDGHPRKLREPLVQQTLDKKISNIMKIKMYKTKTCGRLKEPTESLTVLSSRGKFCFQDSLNLDWMGWL